MSCRRHAPSLPLCVWVWLALDVLLHYQIPLAASTSVSFLCPNPVDRQFTIVVPTKEPLGLRLGDKLEVLEFITDSQGRSRVVEASGLAEIGDRLIAVNDVSLVGKAFQSALVELGRATLPKTLRFETYDGRCMVPIGGPVQATNGSTSTANATNRSPSTSTSGQSYDSVVLSLGKKDSDVAFYAVLSAAGQPPGCLFREVIIADPPHACSPLLVNATDRYVVVTELVGCPAHQKAALAQEAGAKGVIFVQRMGEKPLQIKLPSGLPKPISLPLVMVSFDSGWQIYETITNKALPMQTPQLRFVFDQECASEKYAIHPDEDPLQLSVVNRMASVNAGFLSLTVAESASKTLNGAAFEFLKPSPTDAGNGKVPALPLGRYPLFVKAAASLNACELRPDRQPPQLVFWASEIEDAFVAVHLQDAACSIATQVAFFATKKAMGIVFADASFPRAASLESTRLAAQQAAIPFVFVSEKSIGTMLDYGRDDQANHVLIEFAGENALHHQWDDLRLAADVTTWPSTKRARERLFYRMLKDQQSLSSEEGDQMLVTHERHEALQVSFQKAEMYHEQRKRVNTNV